MLNRQLGEIKEGGATRAGRDPIGRRRPRFAVRAAALSIVALVAGSTPAFAAPSVYVGNVSSQLSIFDVTLEGALVAADPATVAIEGNPDGIALSPDQASLYVVDTSGEVYQYDVAADGTLTAKDPATVAAGSSPNMIAISPDGDSAYVTDSGAGTVLQYDVGADGKLAPKSTASVAAGVNPFVVAVSPDGSSVYVTNGAGSDGTISQYDVGAGGALAAKDPATVAAGAFPAGIAVRPDGASVYSTELNSFFVRQWDVAANGELSPKDPATVAAGTSPSMIALSPDGQSVYVTNQQTDNVSQYDIAADGKLTAKDPATVAAGDNPFGIAIDADGGDVYVPNFSDTDVQHYEVGAGGVLAAAGDPVTLDAGPRGIAIREDLIGPTVTITSGPTGTVASPDASFAFTADEADSTFECSLDGAAPTGCSSPQAYAGLGDGPHTFSVAATDPWENEGQATARSWTIDPGAPPGEPPATQEPENAFEFGTLKRNKRKGTAKLTVLVPGPGAVELAPSKRLKPAERRADGQDAVRLAIRPRGGTKEKLADRGKAKVKAQVTFTPDGGEPNTQSKRLKLKRNR